MKSPESTQPLACNQAALSPAERIRHEAITAKLFGSAADGRVLDQSLIIRLANEGQTLRDVAEFIAAEQLCCPFLDFQVSVEPRRGALRLILKGRDGVGEFLQLEFAEFLKGPAQ